MIETVEDLIELLSKFPPKTKILTQKWVNRWSGDPEDTDMSDYESCPIDLIKLEKTYIPWKMDDPRRKDKRRTCCYDLGEAISS